MDIFSAIIVQVPLLVPLGAAYGVDPVQLGIIFLANLVLEFFEHLQTARRNGPRTRNAWLTAIKELRLADEPREMISVSRRNCPSTTAFSHRGISVCSRPT